MLVGIGRHSQTGAGLVWQQADRRAEALQLHEQIDILPYLAISPIEPNEFCIKIVEIMK